MGTFKGGGAGVLEGRSLSSMTIACGFSASELIPFVDVAVDRGFPCVMLAADFSSTGGRVSFILGRDFELD